MVNKRVGILPRVLPYFICIQLLILSASNRSGYSVMESLRLGPTPMEVFACEVVKTEQAHRTGLPDMLS